MRAFISTARDENKSCLVILRILILHRKIATPFLAHILVEEKILDNFHIASDVLLLRGQNFFGRPLALFGRPLYNFSILRDKA